MSKLPIDDQQCSQWAIASVSSKGVVAVTESIFDLANTHTGRAHRLKVRTGGIDVGSPLMFSPSSSMSDYTYFRTYKPVSFDDFDGVGARVIGGSALLYSFISLTLWDGPAYVSRGLAFARMSGWGVSLPGAGVDHGVATVVYGSGEPLGSVETIPDIQITTEELIDLKVQITAKDDKIIFVLPDSVLFDFDKAVLKPNSDNALQKTGDAIRTIHKIKKVYINGYTDSKGKDPHNLDLSTRRANIVAGWLVSHGYVSSELAAAVPHGSADPVAPNTMPNGADNPAGREMNRRVEIVVITY